MDPELAKRVDTVVTSSPFVQRSSTQNSADDPEDVCYVFSSSTSLFAAEIYAPLNSLVF